MHLLAAKGDTWGISGPAFAGLYLIAAVVFLIGTLLIRRWIRRGRPVHGSCTRTRVAYLIGGLRRAVATAVAGLRADRAIDVSEDGRLSVVGTHGRCAQRGRRHPRHGSPGPHHHGPDALDRL